MTLILIAARVPCLCGGVCFQGLSFFRHRTRGCGKFVLLHRINNNQIMRKASRQMDAAFALEVLDKAPYVTVSFTRPDGTPYGLPLSLARTDERTFYFHCALEGEKLDCIAHCPTVFLSAVTKCAPTVGPKDGNFTLQYKSATAVGKAELVTDREEKIEGLRVICQRFLPKHMDAFDAAIARSLERTAVVRITLTEPPVGKRKQYNKQGEEMTNEREQS